MMERDLHFTADAESLAGRFVEPVGTKPVARTLFLHGAGQATKERAGAIMTRLADAYRVSSFSFDFSGHGASSGTLADSSLEKRYHEAKAALQASKFESPISVCAFSMGGHVAIQLLKEFKLHSLVLFYSAVYSVDAANIRFGDPQFSKTIRANRSWERSDGFGLLRGFAGNLLVIVGEKDEVIPREVTEMIMSNAIAAKKKELMIIKDAPHLVLPRLYDDGVLFDQVCSSIASSVTS